MREVQNKNEIILLKMPVGGCEVPIHVAKGKIDAMIK